MRIETRHAMARWMQQEKTTRGKVALQQRVAAWSGRAGSTHCVQEERVCPPLNQHPARLRLSAERRVEDRGESLLARPSREPRHRVNPRCLLPVFLKQKVPFQEPDYGFGVARLARCMERVELLHVRLPRHRGRLCERGCVVDHTLSDLSPSTLTLTRRPARRARQPPQRTKSRMYIEPFPAVNDSTSNPFLSEMTQASLFGGSHEPRRTNRGSRQ